MKKVYLLVASLFLSSGAMAHPCNPDDQDFNPDKCAIGLERGKLKMEMADYQKWLDYQRMMGIKVPVLIPKGQLITKDIGALKDGALVTGGALKGGIPK